MEPVSETSLFLDDTGVVVLRRLLLLLVFASSVVWLQALAVGNLSIDRLAAPSVTLCCLCAYLLVRQGRITAAVRVVIWGLAGIVVMQSFLVAGVLTPGLMFLPVLCMAAAWMLGMRSAMAIALFTFLALALLLGIEALGVALPRQDRPPARVALLIAISMAFVIILSAGAVRSYQGHLRRSVQLSLDLHNQVKELRQSEENLLAMFRANPVPSSTNELDGRIIDVNEAWVALYNLPREQVLGKTAQEAGVHSLPDERRHVYEAFARHGRVDGLPITLRTASGALRPFHIYVAPVTIGGRQRLVTSMLDQSDRIAVESAQRAVNERLEASVAARTAALQLALDNLKSTQKELVHAEKLASLGAMVAGISHELNTPIGNTVTVSSTLQARASSFRKAVDKGDLKRSTLTGFLDALDEMTDVILRSTRRASELISSFKQVAVDRASERRRQFDLGELVHDIVTSIRPTMRKTGIDIVVNVPAQVTCDSLPGPLGQILTNLIQNAVVHAFDGAEHGTITIEAMPEPAGSVQRQIVLRVTDNGAGMSEPVRHHVFDPFFTTRLGKGGSGLGLSVSHRLATSVLGGDLSVSSEIGKGSCFTLRFLQNLPELLPETHSEVPAHAGSDAHPKP